MTKKYPLAKFPNKCLLEKTALPPSLTSVEFTICLLRLRRLITIGAPGIPELGIGLGKILQIIVKS